VLVGRLLTQGLWSIYRCLFLYLLTDTAQQALGIVVRELLMSRLGYFWIYVGGQAAKLVLSVFVVIELFHLGLAGHPAIDRFGRRAAGYLLGAAALVSGLGLFFYTAVPPGQSVPLHRFYSFERTMDSILLLFLAGISLFMAWFPVRVRRNVALYVGGFSAYFLARWAGALAESARPDLTRSISIGVLSFSLACLIAGIIFLRREGETTTVVTGHRWNPTEMDRLAGKLESLNASLMHLNR
jgi:Na+/H+-dicarboxylate symporter